MIVWAFFLQSVRSWCEAGDCESVQVVIFVEILFLVFENVKVLYNSSTSFMNVTEAVDYCSEREGYLPVVNSVQQGEALLAKSEYNQFDSIINNYHLNCFQSTGI